MILLIRDQLTCPPTWFHSYRDLTLYCFKDFCEAILIESDDSDKYYHWLKSKGGMDYIAEIVRPGAQDGLHLDIEHRFAPTIVTDRIEQHNFHHLISVIQKYSRAA